MTVAIVILCLTAFIGWAILHHSAQKSGKINAPSLTAIVAVIVMAFVVCFMLVKSGMLPQ